MENQCHLFGEGKKCLGKVLLAFLIVLSVFFAIKAINEIKNNKFIGAGIEPKNTISFSGTGEVSAVPDVANVYFTIRSEAKIVKTAQGIVSEKIDKTLKFLKEQGVAEKDIKTNSYNSYPKYDYQNEIACVTYPCPVRKPLLIGYEVSQSISVKVRNISNIGGILEGLGNLEVTEINGPDFVIDQEEEFKAEARRLAIADAKKKANDLAKDLGVSLVRIVNFSDSGNYPSPMRYDTMALGVAESKTEVAPQLPAGENKITSNVTITYEIR